MKKIIAILLIVSVVFLFVYLDISSYLNLEFIKNYHQDLQHFVADNYMVSWLVAFFIYTAATAISLPGATILTLVVGAVFGFVDGFILVSFASTIGATLTFLLTRFLFRDWVGKKFGDRLIAINKGLKEDGAIYLFSLRLIPILPFFLINILFGLTKIKTTTFYWVSQVGMLLGTAVYVNAGTQLSAIKSSGDILSPLLLMSFVLLGLLPFLAKKISQKIKRCRIYKPYSKPKKFNNNLIVIGAGAGGLVSAYIANVVKAKVTLIEKMAMGGDCLNTGCVPSKALIKTGKIIQYFKNADKYGLEKTNIDVDFTKVMQRVKGIIKKIAPHDSIERYQELGVNVIKGTAKIISPYEVSVNGEILTTKNIILATGAKPFVPNIKGLSDVNYLTSDNIWDLKKLPKKLLVLGGGPIGCELTQVFNRLGSKVTQVEILNNILSRSDIEISEFMQQKFTKEGVEIIAGVKNIEIVVKNNKKYLRCKQNGGLLNIEFDKILIAVGRKANISGFGLKKLGIKTDGVIVSDEFMATNIPNIFVVGDATSKYQFTHMAAHTAWYASVNALFGRIKKFKVDYRLVPKVTFTDPEIAEVGLNEITAKQNNINYEISHYDISDLDRAITESVKEGWIKVLTVPKKDTILGVTIVCENAGEILPEFVLAMKYNLGLNKILNTIHAYPTWNETNKFIAGHWKKSHTSDRILQLLTKFHQWQRGAKN